MPLHLIKLSVGSEDIEDLRRWHAKRLAETGRALTFEKTSAPESWGDSWEEEMARVGKRAGLSVGR